MNPWLLAALLLAPVVSAAQSPGPSDISPPVATPSAVAFTLRIDAPDDIRTVLDRHLELQRYRSLTDLRDDELDRLLEMAQQDASQLVATLGYFSPVIQIQRLPAAPGTGARQILIQVVAGEPTQVRQVNLRFAGPMATDPAAATQRQLITDSWLLPAGQRFSQSRWDAAKQQALRQLTSQRYPAGRISESLADVDPQTHTVRLEFTLDSGAPYRLGALAISGLQRFDAELVRRLASVATGSDYDFQELAKVQQRLTASGYFDSAFVSVDTAADPQAAPVNITVREARLQKVTLGVGASTDSGARLSAEHLHHQLPGLGWRALSKVALDRETQTLGTELTAPPDDAGWRWNASLQLQNQLSGSFDVGSQRWRGGASQNSEHIDRSYYLQYDRADTATLDNTVASIAEAVSAHYAFTLRNYNSLPFPSSGWALGVELGGGTTLGSAPVPFGRVLARWQSLWPLGRQTPTAPADPRAGRLSLRAQAGAVLAKDGTSLPVTQLFLAGGDNSVRGYGLRDIGIELTGGQISAGRYLAVGSVEWQRPIILHGQLTDWESTLFVDAGAVADTPSNLRAKVGIGAGVRWNSPVGPLQIDLAYGVAVKKVRLHLAVGFAF